MSDDYRFAAAVALYLSAWGAVPYLARRYSSQRVKSWIAIAALFLVGSFGVWLGR